MTLTIAWERSVNSVKELVVASDSRLRSSGYKDCCQKIFPLPRRDACIAFAGDTALAFPIIMHIIQSIEIYKDARDGSLDISDSVTKILNVVNQIQKSHRDGLRDEQLHERISTRFFYGGYSWKFGQFKLYQILFDKNLGEFVSNSLLWRRPVLVIGDYAPKAAFLEKMNREVPGAKNGLNYEPLKILNSLCRKADKSAPIGGAPQMLKIYRSGNCLPFAVRGRIDGEKRIILFGRPLLDYEITHHPVIDPVTLRVRYPLQNVKN